MALQLDGFHNGAPSATRGARSCIVDVCGAVMAPYCDVGAFSINGTPTPGICPSLVLCAACARKSRCKC